MVKMALEKIQAYSAFPDICIVYINMPVIDGFRTAKFLRGFHPELKVILFSINENTVNREKLHTYGIEGYLYKGSSPAELERTILVVYFGDNYNDPLNGDVISFSFKDW